MLERQVVIPASPEELWVALTDPREVAQWFGSEVDWELRPGGRARFTESDGSVRRGQVESVSPGRRLSFRWWREDGGDGETSRVTYTLEPDDDGTRLTVTEQPVTVPPGADPPPADTGGGARASVLLGVDHAVGVGALGGASWTDWDTRLFHCWARAGAVAVARSGRR